MKHRAFLAFGIVPISQQDEIRELLHFFNSRSICI